MAAPPLPCPRLPAAPAARAAQKTRRFLSRRVFTPPVPCEKSARQGESDPVGATRGPTVCATCRRFELLVPSVLVTAVLRTPTGGPRRPGPRHRADACMDTLWVEGVARRWTTPCACLARVRFSAAAAAPSEPAQPTDTVGYQRSVVIRFGRSARCAGALCLGRVAHNGAAAAIRNRVQLAKPNGRRPELRLSNFLERLATFRPIFFWHAARTLRLTATALRSSHQKE